MKNAMPRPDHISWLEAAGKLLCSSGPALSRRQIITTPSPFSRVAIGSISGSAYGANFRISRCAIRASAPMPRP